MLKNTLINRAATQKLAKTLGKLNAEVVYVGGAMVSFYIDDVTADDVRPTKDLDITLEIHTLGELESLREALIKKGLRQSSEDKVICRFRLDDIKVNVMSTKEVGWAPANRWFAPGFERRYQLMLDEMEISLMPLPYFLASKFDAFFNRGSKDPRTSHDFENIVYILTYTSDLTQKIMEAEDAVRNYLKESFGKIESNKLYQEAIVGNLYADQLDEAFEMIMAKVSTITNGI
ncbi:MAG: putative nucleotidyltransferase [Roseivirga sp.]|jgi:predicted nucleotidyltransferase